MDDDLSALRDDVGYLHLVRRRRGSAFALALPDFPVTRPPVPRLGDAHDVCVGRFTDRPSGKNEVLIVRTRRPTQTDWFVDHELAPSPLTRAIALLEGIKQP